MLLLLLWTGLGHAQTTTMISWKPGTNYPTYSVAVGDTARFVWSSTHSIFRHPTGTCDTTASTELAPTASHGDFSYTFQDTDQGISVTFASHMGDDCTNGMIVTFNVGTIVAASPALPTGAPTMSSVLALGETAQFMYDSSTGSSQLALPHGRAGAHHHHHSSPNIPSSVDTISSVTFSCQLSTDCPHGMALKFVMGTVDEAGTSTAIATCECAPNGASVTMETYNQASSFQLGGGIPLTMNLQPALYDDFYTQQQHDIQRQQYCSHKMEIHRLGLDTASLP